MSGGTQRYTSPQHQGQGMKILNISLPRMRIKLTTCRVYTRLCPCATTGYQVLKSIQ